MDMHPPVTPSAAAVHSPKIRVFADFAAELLLQYRRRVDALLD
jgi:hypothetical protein